jgi:hypothetical protein
MKTPLPPGPPLRTTTTASVDALSSYAVTTATTVAPGAAVTRWLGVVSPGIAWQLSPFASHCCHW